jgi:hypothetical protein
MKAVVLQDFGGPEKLKWKETPRPVPGPGQVLIRTAARSLNPVDLKRASGTMRQFFPVEFPFIPGGEISQESLKRPEKMSQHSISEMRCLDTRGEILSLAPADIAAL